MRYRPFKKNIPVSSLVPDPEGAGMLEAPGMQVYDRIIMAAMESSDFPDARLSTALRELSAVPVQDRYVSRVVAALGFAFGDFDSACIKLDLDTLPFSETDRLEGLMEQRSIQFWILMRTFFGSERAKALISAALEDTDEMPDGYGSKRPAAA
jgi:hypothetical protein